MSITCPFTVTPPREVGRTHRHRQVLMWALWPSDTQVPAGSETRGQGQALGTARARQMQDRLVPLPHHLHVAEAWVGVGVASTPTSSPNNMTRIKSSEQRLHSLSDGTSRILYCRNHRLRVEGARGSGRSHGFCGDSWPPACREGPRRMHGPAATRSSRMEVARNSCRQYVPSHTVAGRWGDVTGTGTAAPPSGRGTVSAGALVLTEAFLIPLLVMGTNSGGSQHSVRR